MKKKSSKLAKLERNRFSILTNNLDYCIICGKTKQDLNEIYPGRNRQNSMKYGLVIPMCRSCHTKYTNDRNMQLYWMKLGQEKFEEMYEEDFISIFKRNYL
jgi:hypothetical protein